MQLLKTKKHDRQTDNTYEFRFRGDSKNINAIYVQLKQCHYTTSCLIYVYIYLFAVIHNKGVGRVSFRVIISGLSTKLHFM